MTNETDAPVFDPFSDTYFNDPYALYRRLRDETPVHYNEKYDFWALARYDDVDAAHRDVETFTSTHGVDLFTLTLDPDLVRYLGQMIMMDPPEHQRLRGLVSKVFTPRAVQALEPMVREVITGFVDGIGERPDFDGVEDFAALFPVEIISRMLGVPEGDRQQVRLWLDVGLHRDPGSAAPTQAGAEAMIASGAFFLDLVKAKQRNPGDDMISRLTQAEIERPEGGSTRLTDEEIAGFAGLLGGAGAETVTKLVGNAFVLFASHPDQWKAIVGDHSLIPDAVEEVLRYQPPSQYQGRFSLKDSTWHGMTIPAGHPVLLLTGAATRDERAYDDPDRFDISRTPGRALSFGVGIHHCLGASLARMESRIAFEEMARRWPDFAVDESGLARVNQSNVAGYSKVPVSICR